MSQPQQPSKATIPLKARPIYRPPSGQLAGRPEPPERNPF